MRIDLDENIAVTVDAYSKGHGDGFGDGYIMNGYIANDDQGPGNGYGDGYGDGYGCEGCIGVEVEYHAG